MSEDTSKAQRIIEKIKALRRIADSTHSKHEKETALAMSAKLITEHQLSELDLEKQTGQTEEDDLVNGSVVYETGRTTPWKAELVWGVAELNNVLALKFKIRHDITHKQGSRYRIFGKPSDIEICKYMFDYLEQTITELAADYVPGGKKRGVNPERESWCLGAVHGFLSKMKDERRKAIDNAPNATAMVLVNRQRALTDAYTSKHNAKLKTAAPSKAQRTEDTYNSGWKKGHTLNVAPGMGGSGNASKKLGG